MCPYRIGVKPLTYPLDLVDFFDHYEQESHQIAAINELQRRINDLDPSLLQSNSEWFLTWQVDGKKKRSLRRHNDLDSL
jgi:hypothetical protein